LKKLYRSRGTNLWGNFNNSKSKGRIFRLWGRPKV